MGEGQGGRRRGKERGAQVAGVRADFLATQTVRSISIPALF